MSLDDSNSRLEFEIGLNRVNYFNPCINNGIGEHENTAFGYKPENRFRIHYF